MPLGNSYPAELLGADGQQVLPDVAAVQFTDSTDQPGSGGGGSAITSELISGTDGTVPAGDSYTGGNWTSVQGGGVVDLTDPTTPKFVADGLYLVCFNVSILSDVTFLVPCPFSAGDGGSSVPNDATASGADVASGNCSFVATATAGSSISPSVTNPNAADQATAGLIVSVTKLA